MPENSENRGDMPRSGDGLAAAVAALDPRGAVEAEAETGDLFGGSPLLSGREDALMPAKRRGRPVGALNKTTEAWKSFILANYRSPLLFLADVTAVDTEKLAVVLELTVGETLKLQMSAAEALAPYLHRKQPIAIDAGEDKPLPLVEQIVLGADAITRLFPQLAENKGELEFTPAEVAGEKSQIASDGGASD